MTPAARNEPDGLELAAPGARSLHFGIGLAATLAVALALRVLYLNQVAALPFFNQPIGDSAAHLRRAALIASGSLLPSQPFFYCSIFYPYFLAVALTAFHGSLYAVCLVQMIVGTAVVGLLAWIGRSLYGPVAGLATGALAALYGPFAFLEGDVLGVAWGQLDLVLGMAACLWWARQRDRSSPARLGPVLAGGAALGFAIVERANLLLLLPILAAWCVGVAGFRAGVRAALALAIGAAIPLSIVLALNVAGTGQWVPLTTSGGINLELGYHAGASGTYDEPWEREAPEFSARHTEPEEAMTAWASLRTGRNLTTQQASGYWMRLAVDYIVQHPAQVFALTVRKAALLLNDAEIPNHLNFGFIRERAPALRLMPVHFTIVFVLAVLGAAEALRRRRSSSGTVLLLLVSGGALLGVLPFTVADRYRAPLVPPLIVAAGVGVEVLIRIVRNREARRDRGLLFVLVPCALLVPLTMAPLTRPLQGRDWWMFAQAEQARGNLPAAIAAYESALREEGDRAELLTNLADAYRRAGDRGRAIATLRRAIAAEPRLAYPHKNLGMLLVAQGSADSARAELAEAAQLAPDDPQVHGMLGALAAERGERAAADSEFARARRLAPDDRRLLDLIRRYEGDSVASGTSLRSRH